MYFMGISKWFIISGRLVAGKPINSKKNYLNLQQCFLGIGLGVLSCAFSDVIKNSSVEERSAVLSRVMVGRQVI